MKPDERNPVDDSLAFRTTGDLADSAQPVTKLITGEPISVPAAETNGNEIGNYSLIEKIGQGGFGTVWRAEQNQPVRREVAIKLLKRGMDSQEVVARFSQERQALAMMDHPGIAKVFDAGITDDGTPYFVMELVRGLPLNQYCDDNEVRLRDRLEIFIQLCSAVHHAHLKGIIHRDLKPTNVLVARTEHGPVIKVIDFGIAKAAAGTLVENAMQTQVGQFMGTPAYMSPEQADGRVNDIDIRSDVYSLGVVLYELLTRELPFDVTSISDGYEALRRMIREKLPPRPSHKLSEIIAQRPGRLLPVYRNESAKLVNSVRGDLDWIVMKALEKDRFRRYDTAQEMAADIRRHLSHEAVIARPPTSGYLLSRFVARNRGTVIAATLVVLIMIGATAFSTRMFFKEQAARRSADAESARSRQMVNILSKMILAAGPSVAQGRDTSLLKDLLASTTQEIEHDLKDQPEVELEVRNLIAEAYMDIGEFDKALSMQQRVTELQQQLYPSDHRIIAEGLADLAEALEAVDRLPEAENALRAAIISLQKVSPVQSETIARHRELLAWILERKGDLHGAEREARQALSEYQGEENNAKLFRAQVLMTLGVSLMKLAKFQEAELVHRESLDIYRQSYTKPHPNVVVAINNLCHMLCDVGEFDEAEGLAKEGLELEQVLYGESIGTCTDAFYKVLAQAHASRDEYAQAIDYSKKAIAIAAKVYSEDHRFTNDKRALLVNFQIDAGLLDEAAETLKEAKRIGGTGESADNSLVLAEARLLLQLGKLAEARELAQRDYERTRAESSQPSIGHVKAIYLLAKIEAQLGNTAIAADMLDTAINTIKPDVNSKVVLGQRLLLLRSSLPK